MIFKITGQVRESERKIGVPNLVVRAFDRDLIYDDLLGSVTTDEDGRFEITYEGGDYKELFDKRPDIYLTVKSPDYRRTIYTTEDKVRFEAGKEEHFIIDISREVLGDLALPYKEEKGMEMKAFFEKLNVSDKLRTEFFEDPERVASEHGVEFSDEQKEKINRAVGFVQKYKELKVKRIYPDPVEYPVEVLAKREIARIPSHIYYPPPNYLVYPARFYGIYPPPIQLAQPLYLDFPFPGYPARWGILRSRYLQARISDLESQVMRLRQQLKSQ